MNDGVFPRRDPVRGFDLMTANPPQRGDRRRRNEDRYAFLQGLLAARSAVLVTYTGLGLRDNQAQPPSIVVTELIAAIERAAIADNGSAAAAITLEHPLHPFSERYFTAEGSNPRLTTYAAEWQPWQDGQPTAAPRPFARGLTSTPQGGLALNLSAGGQLASASPIPRKLRLDDLARFLEDPSRAFLRNQIGIVIHDEDDRLEANEPFTLDPLSGYSGASEVLAALRHSLPLEPVQQRLRAEGNLPSGELGAAALASLRARAQRLVDGVTHRLGGAWSTLPAASYVLNCADWQIETRLVNLSSAGPLTLRAGEIRAATRLRAWVCHLAWNIAAPAQDPHVSWLVGMKAQKVVVEQFAPIERAPALGVLGDLLTLFVEGQSALLPFYPQTSLAYCQALVKGKADPQRAAQVVFNPNRFAHGRAESERPYIALAIRDAPEPLDAAFMAMAERVWRPILACLSGLNEDSVDESAEDSMDEKSVNAGDPGNIEANG